MLDSHTKEIVKSTIPALKQYGEDITKVFYRELFGRYPQVQGMFDMEKQKELSQILPILLRFRPIIKWKTTQGFGNGDFKCG